MGIESLVIKHARLSDLRRELKRKGCEEAARCTRMESDSDEGYEFRVGVSCIGFVHSCWRDEANEPYPHEPVDFEQTWAECIEDGQVCQHCQSVRKLRAERMRVSAKLGGVRAAITRVGRRLARENLAQGKEVE